MADLLIVAFAASDAEQLAGFGQAFGDFDLLMVSGDAPAIGAAKVLNGGLSSIPPADSLCKPLTEACRGYSHVAVLSSMRGKDVMARVAAHLDAAMVTDVIAMEGPTRFTRPMVAGTVLADVEVLSTPVVLTVRPAGFGSGEERANAEASSVSLDGQGNATRTEEAQRSGGRPDLGQAKIVVSGGRPLGDAETFEKMIGGLADHLGGAAGATRAAVDSGIAPNELQVGQTGKIVAPDLYIACGISGATQHLAGIKDSKVIVAVNTDGDAPIVEAADYHLPMDLFEAIPQMMEKMPKA